MLVQSTIIEKDVSYCIQLAVSIVNLFRTFNVFLSSVRITRICRLDVNPLPDDKILRLPKLKAFTDNISNVTQNIKVGLYRIENFVEKEENAGYQHFLLFPYCFQKAFSSSVSKVLILW